MGRDESLKSILCVDNSQILDKGWKNQKQALYEKLNFIDCELSEYTNLNNMMSPSHSVRNSQNFDNLSIASFECSHFDASQCQMKQSDINNLIKYLQDFLPLKMKKQIEGIKMKKMMNDENENEDE